MHNPKKKKKKKNFTAEDILIWRHRVLMEATNDTKFRNILIPATLDAGLSILQKLWIKKLWKICSVSKTNKFSIKR
jgi:hypothetical protein